MPLSRRRALWAAKGLPAPKSAPLFEFAGLEAVAADRETALRLDLSPGEIGLSRPCVHRVGSRYAMWYAVRGEHYRIGYAESPDGLHWERMDQHLVWQGAAGAWESDEQAYPCVLRHGSDWYMLYNGNRYGATGFGWARLVRGGPHG